MNNLFLMHSITNIRVIYCLKVTIVIYIHFVSNVRVYGKIQSYIHLVYKYNGATTYLWELLHLSEFGLTWSTCIYVYKLFASIFLCIRLVVYTHFGCVFEDVFYDDISIIDLSCRYSRGQKQPEGLRNLHELNYYLFTIH